MPSKIDLFVKISGIAKNVFLCLFLCYLISLGVSINRSVNNIENSTQQLYSDIRKEAPSFKLDVLARIDNLTNNLDKRTDSIERNLFARMSSIEINSFKEISKLNDNVTDNVTVITNNTTELLKEYKELSRSSRTIIDNVNKHIDCQYNDICWPNLFTDLVLDTRNLVRDTSTTVAIVNKEVPGVVYDFKKASESLAVGFPKIVTNTADITQNINRITKPKWYDRLLGLAASGTMIWYNVNRTLR